MHIDWAAPIAVLRSEFAALLTPSEGPQEAKAITEQLLMHLTGWTRSHLLRSPDYILPAMQQSLARQAAQRLLSGEPVQHITGIGHFYGRDFYVSPDVLIPRPDTEGLAVWARDLWLSQQWPKEGGTLLDVGTGSGCIAITLERELAERTIQVQALGVDVSPAALLLAEKNAAALSSSASFQLIDILEATPSSYQSLHLLISNPPYIPRNERAELQRQVRDHEPDIALFVPDDDPLRFYRRIAELGRHWLIPNGWIMFEIHQDFAEETVNLLSELGYREIALRKDLGGRDRMIAGKN